MKVERRLESKISSSSFPGHQSITSGVLLCQGYLWQWSETQPLHQAALRLNWSSMFNIPQPALGVIWSLKTMKAWWGFRGRRTQFQSASHDESKQLQLQYLVLVKLQLCYMYWLKIYLFYVRGALYTRLPSRVLLPTDWKFSLEYPFTF